VGPPRIAVISGVGTLLALVLAMTVGLFGIDETLHGRLVPTALVVESVGVVVLWVTIGLVAHGRRAVSGR
jgi:hypothetical protein